MLSTRVDAGRRIAGLLAASLCAGTTVSSQTAATPRIASSGPEIEEVRPARVRVHERIALAGSGFGRFVPGRSAVTFAAGGGDAVAVLAPYVWRRSYVEVRVPSGLTGDWRDVRVSVRGRRRTSDPVSIEVVRLAPSAEPSFHETTRIVRDVDVSPFLGDPSLNLARTKDAEVGDIDRDGYPDLVDGNSNNATNGTHAVLRRNLGPRRGFAAVRAEPVSPEDDAVPFAVVVPPGGTYVGNGVVYDSDLVDLTNDGLLDWVQAVSRGGADLPLRVAVNGFDGVPGRFLEASRSWLTEPVSTGAADDLDHADLDGDGFVDLVVAFRFRNELAVFLNEDGRKLRCPPMLLEPNPSGSVHDVFVLDADGDGRLDVAAVTDLGDSRLLRNGGGSPPLFTPMEAVFPAAFTGVSADFDGDGLDDFALGGFLAARVFLNERASPGSFREVPLEGADTVVYDLEAGDLDLDGRVDLVAAGASREAGDTARIWLNRAEGFHHLTAGGAGSLLPGLAGHERLSADLIDQDLDGDLDLYLSGSDSQPGPGGFGALPNQFFQNRLVHGGPAPR